MKVDSVKKKKKKLNFQRQLDGFSEFLTAHYGEAVINSI